MKEESAARGEHLLLTLLGTNPRSARYTLEGQEQEIEAALAPVALVDLLPEADRPDRILAICTPEAKEDAWPILEEGLGKKCGVEAVEFTPGNVQEDVNTYLEKITAVIPEKVDLTVDVTHGFRHFSFLTYIAILYLAALRGVRVRGAYYGLLGQGQNGTSPFLDLRPLLKLPRWIHALEVLGETGSALPMAETIRSEGSRQIDKDLARNLSYFSKAYLSGLPLELGRQAQRLRDEDLTQLEGLLSDDHNLPLADKLIERLDRILHPFTLPAPDPKVGKPWKHQVVLSENELKRQAYIIDDLLRHENVAAALGLMDEWTISWVVYRKYRKKGDCNEWIGHGGVRGRATLLLGALAAVGRDPDLSCTLTKEQRSLGSFWHNLTKLRNAYHHHGMRLRALIDVDDTKSESQLHMVRKNWAETLRSCPDFSLSFSEQFGGRVLVSPFGKQRGVLFSAINACRPEGSDPDRPHENDPGRCLVICSHETKGLIEEALGKAGYAGEFESLLLEDPQGGCSEIEPLVKVARKHFIGAEETLVNVTGGTTLMGLVAEGLANEARRLACPVRRFGLIDRRPPKEQDGNPYQVGPPFWLDPVATS